MRSDGLRASAAAQLRRAVQTMRDACDQAERDLAPGDGNACQRVLHAMSWGLANASSSITTAMSHVEDAHAIAAFEAQERA